MCEKKYKRYLVMGLKNGELHHIIARRGNTPDDIVNRALEIVSGIPIRELEAHMRENPHFIPWRGDLDLRKRAFDRLYLVEVGDEGTYGNSTNLKLQEIVPPPPKTDWSLVRTKGLYG